MVADGPGEDAGEHFGHLGAGRRVAGQVDAAGGQGGRIGQGLLDDTGVVIEGKRGNRQVAGEAVDQCAGRQRGQ